MKPCCLVITGTSGSGKTTLARALCSDPAFCHARAVTTRSVRAGDEADYDHLTLEAFEALSAGKELLIDTEYRGHRYGVRLTEVEAIRRKGQRAVLTLTPESTARLCREKNRDGKWPYLSLFVDAPDAILDERLHRRGDATDVEVVRKQRATDRTDRTECLYAIENRDISHCIELIKAIWDMFDRHGVLSNRLVSAGVRCSLYLEHADERNVQGASYDLSLGDEYFYGGRIRTLSERRPILIIEPYDYAIVTSHELANLPSDVCARFDLAVSLFAQGIVLSNGPQVDPGFRGPLFCLLFNTSSSPVLLKRRQHYATLELHKLIEPTGPYKGQYQAKRLLDYLPANAARGAINELKKEVEQLKKESKNLQTLTLGVISIFLSLVAVWVSLK